MSEEKLNLHQKLIEVRKQVKFLKKDEKGFNFVYASGSSVLGSLRPELDKQGIIIIPKMIDPELRDGNLFFSKIEYEIINADKPEDRFTIPWVAIGRQKDPSQSLGSGLTYSERYLLMKLNLIPTDEDDPDARPPKTDNESNGKYSQKPQNAPKNEQKTKPDGNGHTKPEKTLVSEKMAKKINAACMFLAGGREDTFKTWYHKFFDFTDDKGTKHIAPDIEKLSKNWAYRKWKDIETYYDEKNLDISAALMEYGAEGDDE